MGKDYQIYYIKSTLIIKNYFLNVLIASKIIYNAHEQISIPTELITKAAAHLIKSIEFIF